MQLTKKVIEKKYNCILEKDSGFDDSHKFWRALPKDDNVELYAEGWTLSEIVEELEERLNKKIN